jgi:hypothetical protein
LLDYSPLMHLQLENVGLIAAMTVITLVFGSALLTSTALWWFGPQQEVTEHRWFEFMGYRMATAGKIFVLLSTLFLGALSLYSKAIFTQNEAVMTMTVWFGNILGFFSTIAAISSVGCLATWFGMIWRYKRNLMSESLTSTTQERTEDATFPDLAH